MQLWSWHINTLRQRQNGPHLADKTLKYIFWNEIFITISLSVPKDLTKDIPALIQIMACRWPGDKPFSEPMMVRSLMHMCVTRPQWVKCDGELQLFQDEWYLGYYKVVKFSSWTLNVISLIQVNVAWSDSPTTVYQILTWNYFIAIISQSRMPKSTKQSVKYWFCSKICHLDDLITMTSYAYGSRAF